MFSDGTQLAAAAVFLAATTGALLVTQNGINTNLRLEALKNPILTACVSFSVGLGCISAAAIIETILMRFRTSYTARGAGSGVGTQAATGPVDTEAVPESYVTEAAQSQGSDASVHPKKTETAQKGTRCRMLQAPWYAYTGGVLGPCYVVAAILLSKPLGFATFQLCSTLGQLTTSLLADSFGLLMLKRQRPTPLRILCIVLLALGTGLTIDSIDVSGPWYIIVLCCIAALAAGCIFPVQACVNATMQAYVGTALRATVVSFTGGVIVLGIITAISLAFVDESIEIENSEPYMWLGGFCGCAVVAGMVLGVPAIGAAAYSALFIAAQLVTAFVFDALGAFGFARKSVTARRAIGVCISVAAAVSYQLAPHLSSRCRVHHSAVFSRLAGRKAAATCRAKEAESQPGRLAAA
mmetsp:Transcript_15901/g.31060  ORF Transcript_15901/g.31060 Transcript_15901/m.31060 type:complete len:410 (-) Transcript_15901:198-1427(-)